MRTSYAMIASRVTPPAKDEGAKVEGVEEAGGVTVLVRGCLGQCWAPPRQTVAASMAHITEKCVDFG